MIAERVAVWEAIHYASLLLESARLEYVGKTYGDSLEKSYAAATHLPPDIKEEIDGQEGETVGIKLVGFFASCDPSQNKAYTQWMVQRHLRGELKIEDVPGLTSLLEYFDENKRRFEKRDINQYKTIDELAQAVNAFFAATPQAALRNDKDMQVLYDSPNFAVIRPKSAKGAKELGQGTIWCTAWSGARNRFDYYERQLGGPIYVIIDKAKRQRWQFFLHKAAVRGPEYDASEFMDRANKGIDLGDFIRAYPIVFNILGEAALVPYINRIGLSQFSDETLKRIPANQIWQYVNSADDLKRFPPEQTTNLKLAEAILLRVCKLPGREGAISLGHHYAEVFADDPQFFEELLAKDPLVLAILPKKFHNDERKLVMLSLLSAYTSFEFYVPKPWPKAVSDKYWGLRSRDDLKLSLADVPDEYRSNYVIVTTLARHPEDMEQFKSLLDDKVLEQIIAKTPKVISQIPVEKMTKAVASNAIQQISRWGVVSMNEMLREFARFPTSVWPQEQAWMELLAGSGAANDLTFEQLPKPWRDNEPVLMQWVVSNPANVGKMTAKSCSDTVLKKALDRSHDKSVISALTPQVCNEDRFIALMENEAKLPSAHISNALSDLPKHLRTTKVYSALTRLNLLKLADIPKEIITPEAILTRLKLIHHYSEVVDVPARLWNKGLAAQIVAENRYTMPFIPQNMLCEDVLYHWLAGLTNAPFSSRADDSVEMRRKHFERFDQSMWSHRTVALAVKMHLMPADPEAIPEHLRDHSTMSSVIAKGKGVLSKVPTDLIDENSLVAAVAENRDLIMELKDKQWTEPVLFSAIQTHASILKINWIAEVEGHANRATMMNDPRETLLKFIDRWSERCFKEAVGFLCYLDSVPTQWRTDEMAKRAVFRNPLAVSDIPTPGDWMTATASFFEKGGKFKERQWMAGLEMAGVFKQGKKFVDVTSMDAKPAGKGFSYVVLKLAKNFRVFFLDKQKNIVFRIGTDKGQVHAARIKDMTTYKEVVRAFAKAEEELLSPFHYWDLNRAGVYKTDKGLRFEEKLPHTKHPASDKLKWADVNYVGGGKRIAFVDGKPVLWIYQDMTKAAFGRGTYQIQGAGLYVEPFEIWPYAAEIAAYLNACAVQGWSSDLRKAGVTTGKNSEPTWVNLLATKVAERGDFEVYQSGRRVTIMHRTKGFMAGGTLRNSGAVENVEFNYDYKDLSPKLRDLLENLPRLSPS